MAGHSGGSWKVAYADFVTAMMAFFLVMWIGAQDEKTRGAVAHYFRDPFAGSNRSTKSGAIPEPETAGPVLDETNLTPNWGRESHSAPKTPSPQTAAVSRWVFGDDKQREEWVRRAQTHRAAAEKLAAQTKGVDPDKETVRRLEQDLRQELTTEALKQTKSVQRELLLKSLGDVNFRELAEDILRSP